MLEQRRRGGLVDAERQAHRTRTERGDRIGQLGRRAPVVGGHHGAGIGQEAAGGDAGAGEAQDDGATAAQVVDGADRRAQRRSSSVHRSRSHAAEEDAEAEQPGQRRHDPEAERDLLLRPADELEVVVERRHAEDAPAPQPDS